MRWIIDLGSSLLAYVFGAVVISGFVAVYLFIVRPILSEFAARVDDAAAESRLEEIGRKSNPKQWEQEQRSKFRASR